MTAVTDLDPYFKWPAGRLPNVCAPVDLVEPIDDGLLVAGQLHLEESEKAHEIWRSVKAGAVALSFGYLVKPEHTRDDGIRELTELDLYEIT
jgi:phage head maturation protease